MSKKLDIINNNAALGMGRSQYIGVAEQLKNQYMKIVFSNEDDFSFETTIIAERENGTTIRSKKAVVEQKYNEPVYRVGTLDEPAHSLISELYLPKETKIIGAQLCPEASQLKNITLPPTLEVIEDAAFPACGFTEVKIPQTIQTIGSAAFAECSAAEIHLPSTVREVSEGAFDGVKALHYSGDLEGAPWGALEWIKD